MNWEFVKNHHLSQVNKWQLVLRLFSTDVAQILKKFDFVISLALLYYTMATPMITEGQIHPYGN